MRVSLNDFLLLAAVALLFLTKAQVVVTYHDQCFAIKKGYQGFLDSLFGVEGNAESNGTSSLASGLSTLMMDKEPGEIRINTAPVSEEEIRLLGASLFEMNNEVRTASPNKRVSLQRTGWIMSLVGVILIGLAWVISFRADLISC